MKKSILLLVLFTLVVCGLEAEAGKRVLFGISGIGNGHCSRQHPILQHLLEEGHQVMVFTYGAGLDFFRDRFPQHQNLTVIPVANSYYVFTPSGIDYGQSAILEKNQVDAHRINALAMDRATKELGCPDLVISDCEMLAAQYAYAKRAPLVTLDQQSKFLVGDFEPMLNGTTCMDEVERLSLFFPGAVKRMAVSFFKVPKRADTAYFDVDIYPPMLRPAVIKAKGASLCEQQTILVYVTAQQNGEQPVGEWINAIQDALPEDFNAHIFLPLRLELPENSSNTFFYHHNDRKFDSILFAAHAVISTAGHNLLSEALYLEKPVYALPLQSYEQQINALIIAQGSFGVCSLTLTSAELQYFFVHIEDYRENIRRDNKYLFKEPGNDMVIEEIDRILSQNART